jgi:AcrR family transcriptional regulator
MARVEKRRAKPTPVTNRAMPPSRRGQRTRAALVTAARSVFERDGYLDARITDIADEAKVASGTFYTYFISKEEIFEAVVESVEEDMLHMRIRERVGEAEPGAMISAANAEYLKAYERNARLMAVFEQVAQINDRFRDLRAKRSNAFLKRNAKLIQELQERGQADPSLDPMVAAEALSWMVSRMAYVVFVLGRPIPIDLLTSTLNQLWVNALRLGDAPMDGVSVEAAEVSRI